VKPSRAPLDRISCPLACFARPHCRENIIRAIVQKTSSQPWRIRILNSLWFGRSVRSQILIVFILLNLIAAAVAGGVIIFKAGTSTRIEIAASMRLAELMVSEAVQLIRQGIPAEQFLKTLPGQLRFVRHVRVGVRDAAGQPVSDRAADLPEPPRDDDRAAAPAWFARLIGPHVERHEVPVVAGGQTIGTVEIVSEPRDEIAEVWENSIALAMIAAVTVLVITAILYLVLGRVLDPLTALGSALRGLERRDYKVRLARPKVLEFAAITDRFNALAGALDDARVENLALNRRVITAQDDERRRTALELHDEVGPSLFGLKANAASIAKAAASLPDPAARTVAERVRDLTAIIDHLQGINRNILNRLRPMALGHVPLQEILGELVHERARQHPQIAFTHQVATLARSYGDTVDLTVYRCVQESLTNAIRHANAKAIEVMVVDVSHAQEIAANGAHLSSPAPHLPSGRLRPSATGYGEGRGEGALRTFMTRGEPPHPPSRSLSSGRPEAGHVGSVDFSPHSPSQPGASALMRGRGEESPADGAALLELTVRDDGFGIAYGMPPGFGLRGMRERVQALGGDFVVETGSGGGTCVHIVIPLPSRQDEVSGVASADGPAGGAADIVHRTGSAT
jgi:two-component system, NarL family, sensor histidine kinase UhpB